MNVLQIVIIVFCILESLNILVLYSGPTLKQGNGVGVFKKVHEIDPNDETFQLIKYLTNWVANVKVIFVALAIIIVIFADKDVQLYAAIAFVFSIALFYFTLYPIMKKIDEQGRLVVKGYSKTLAYMISSFIFVFIAAIIIYISVGGY